MANAGSRLAYVKADYSKASSLTLVAGLARLQDVEEEDLAQHLADFAAYRNHIRNGSCNSSKSVKKIRQLRKDAKSGSWCRFACEATPIYSGRTLLATQEGYIGLGPRVLKKGDLCCLLYGANVPFILRRCGDYYLLLGESYIHGIMHGEAMEKLRSGELREEVFAIH